MIYICINLLILMILGSIIYIDFRICRIPNILVIFFLMVSLWYLKKNFYGITALAWGCGFMVFKILMENILKKPALGAGDVKLVCVMGLWFPLDITPFFLILIGGSGILLGLIYKIFLQKDFFPFAPALILGFLWCVKIFYFY